MFLLMDMTAFQTSAFSDAKYIKVRVNELWLLVYSFLLPYVFVLALQLCIKSHPFLPTPPLSLPNHVPFTTRPPIQLLVDFSLKVVIFSVPELFKIRTCSHMLLFDSLDLLCLHIGRKKPCLLGHIVLYSQRKRGQG